MFLVSEWAKNMVCLKEKQTLRQEQIKQQRKDEKPKHKIRAKVEQTSPKTFFNIWIYVPTQLL